MLLPFAWRHFRCHAAAAAMRHAIIIAAAAIMHFTIALLICRRHYVFFRARRYALLIFCATFSRLRRPDAACQRFMPPFFAAIILRHY